MYILYHVVDVICYYYQWCAYLRVEC